MVSGFDELQKYFDKKLTKRTLDEFRRQAGILGKSIMKNEKYAHAIVNASFKNATYSDRIWMYHGMLKAELEGLLASGLIKGENPRKLARHLTKRFGVSAYNAERLMVTELARVQTEAQKQSFIRNGFDEYVYVACTKGDVCPICKGLDDKHFKVDDMMPGENAPPMHPNCHCSTAAYMDNEVYEEWINSYQEHGLNFEDWQSSMESEKLVDKLSKYEKDFEKLTEGYSYDEFVNDFGSVEEGFDGSDANEIKKAKEIGMKIILNPSPMNEKIKELPLDQINYFLLNEIEATQILDMEEPKEIDGKYISGLLHQKFPEATIVLTLGSEGSVCISGDEYVEQSIYKVKTVDTTAAGDTYTGYFIAGILNGKTIKEAMDTASKASAIAVSRQGAAPSIPCLVEVEEYKN